MDLLKKIALIEGFVGAFIFPLISATLYFAWNESANYDLIPILMGSSIIGFIVCYKILIKYGAKE